MVYRTLKKTVELHYPIKTSNFPHCPRSHRRAATKKDDHSFRVKLLIVSQSVSKWERERYPTSPNQESETSKQKKYNFADIQFQHNQSRRTFLPTNYLFRIRCHFACLLFFPLNFAKNTSCHELIRTDASHLHLICSSDNHSPLGHYRYLSALTNITYYDEFIASLPLAGKLRRRAIRTCLNEVCNIFAIQLGRNRQEQFFENFSNYFFNN